MSNATTSGFRSTHSPDPSRRLRAIVAQPSASRLPPFFPWLVALILFQSPCALRAADDKKPDPPPQPALMMINPSGVVAGGTARLVLRGLKLGEASEVKTSAAAATVKLLAKRGAEIPRGVTAAKVGDSEVEIELTLRADAPAGSITLSVVTPQGETAARTLQVGTSDTLTMEREPNDGFRKAQAIDTSHSIVGSIHESRNVDVFRYEGKAGQKLVCEVIAAREGSALDAIVTLYDARGRTLAVCDDVPDSLDPRLEATLPADGSYYVCIADARDLGGTSHPYRLQLRLAQ